MKKALLVGINQYNAKLPKLNTCASSANKISSLLERNEAVNNLAGDINFDCKKLTSKDEVGSEKITRALLKKNCKALFEDEEADVALFYFSGYGFDDHLGTYLVTQDVEQHDEGMALSDLMIYANNSSIKEIYIILDCHYSGNDQNQLAPNEQFALLRKGISVLSVKNCEKDKTNLFTELMVNTLKGGNADVLGNITFVDLYEQTVDVLSVQGCHVVFRCNTSRLTAIRKTIPKLSKDLLLKIRAYFHSPHYKIPMDKEHIPSQNLGKEAKQQFYKNLQKLLKQGLVKPVNAPHLYYAALNGKHCALTERGQQYWALMEKNRI